MSVGPHVEKFNIVSNDQGCTEKCDLIVLDHKCSFWANLVQIIKIVNLS